MVQTLVMNKIKRENIAQHLVEYQLSIINKTVKDALNNQNWRSEFSFTQEEYNVFKHYSISLIKKVFRCNRKKAESTFEWFYLTFGIRVNYEPARI
jgi:hypothetical protein